MIAYAFLFLWKATFGHYSGVYPLLHRGTTYLHFRVHFSRYPQGNALNPARVDMRENEGRMALTSHPSG